MDITTIDTENTFNTHGMSYEDFICYYDSYKDTHGIRPRWTRFEDFKQSDIDMLVFDSEEQFKAEQAEQARIDKIKNDAFSTSNIGNLCHIFGKVELSY